MVTFDSYLENPCSLTFEQMRVLHGKMISEIAGDSEALEFYEDLVKAAVIYAAVRASWNSLTLEEKADKDASRTSHHDSLITHFNMLSRYLRSTGKAAAWRDDLGYEEDNPNNRKAIGDFGCYIVFVNSINAR